MAEWGEGAGSKSMLKPARLYKRSKAGGREKQRVNHEMDSPELPFRAKTDTSRSSEGASHFPKQ